MTPYELFTVIMSVFGIVVIPLLIWIVRRLISQALSDVKLTEVANKMTEIVAEGHKIHADMFAQMAYDREATNTRLRYLEEYFMSHGMGKGQG